MADIKFQFEVTRKDDQQRRVYGWFSVAKDKDGKVLVDRHGDVIDIADLEIAAGEFVKEWRQGGEGHKGGAPHKLIASIVTSQEIQKALGIPPGTMPEGWFGGFEISNEAYSRVAKGELLMFSIECEAMVETVEVDA